MTAWSDDPLAVRRKRTCLQQKELLLLRIKMTAQLKTTESCADLLTNSNSYSSIVLAVDSIMIDLYFSRSYLKQQN